MIRSDRTSNGLYILLCSGVATQGEEERSAVESKVLFFFHERNDEGVGCLVFSFSRQIVSFSMHTGSRVLALQKL